MLTLHEIARVLGGDVSGHCARVPGPGHSPGDRSLSITLADSADGFICHSFAGDDDIVCKDYVRQKLGLPEWKPKGKGKLNGNGAAHASEDDVAKALMAAISKTPAPRVLEKTYDYVDADGALLYQKLRYVPKFFSWRRPDGKGGWIPERGDRIVPYRLPELLQYPDGTIFLCEGEKDADRVASCCGYCATNVAQGDLNQETCAAYFANRDVIILRDNDDAGIKRASDAAKALHCKAKTIRIVLLPGAKDVSVWLDNNGNDREEMARLCFAAPLWEPAPETQSTASRGGTSVSCDDFHSYMPMHQYLFAATGEMWPASSVNARVAPVGLVDGAGNPVLNEDGKQKYVPASVWIDKNKPVEQMTWYPGHPKIIRDRLIMAGGFIDRVGVSIYNQYREPTLRHGDPDKAGPWLDHVRKVYPDNADHLIKWMAHRVQRPEEKINHAIVLGGKPGIGKDTLIEPVKRAVRPWNVHEILPDQLLGSFNGFLKSVILRINEAHDLGEYDRYSFYDRSKAYIAAPPDVIRLNEKFIKEYQIPNLCGVIITTNHKTDGLFLPADDRRHYVAWSDLTKEEFEADYWLRLYRW
jgi:Family of unknown function (DUF5906)